MAKSKKKKPDNVLVQNRKARHDYRILETLEVGMQLSGAEVKSVRSGQASLAEAYVRPENNQLWLLSAHINPYENKGYADPDPIRPRRLLAHEREISRLASLVQEKGRTLVPLDIHVGKTGWLKMTVGLGAGKTHGDKRNDLKEKVQKREMEQQDKVRRQQ